MVTWIRSLLVKLFPKHRKKVDMKKAKSQKCIFLKVQNNKKTTEMKELIHEIELPQLSSSGVPF